MGKKFLRRYLPDETTLRKIPALRPFARWLGHPAVWHLHRRSASLGFAISQFMNFVPMPFPMLPAIAIAVALRANVPIVIVGAQTRNPFTISLFALLSYQIGAWALSLPTHDIAFEVSWSWVTGEFARIWPPFLLGCLINAIVAGLVSYVAMQSFWRCYVSRAWRRRQRLRA